MREPLRSRSRSTPVANARVAFELILNLYAVASVVLITRLMLRMLAVDDRLWIGRLVYRITDPVVTVLNLLPGAEQQVIGDATLLDFTLLAPVILFPIYLMARSGKQGAR